MPIKTTHTFCRICEAACGLTVDVQNDRIVDIRPNPNHVATEGFACIKGLYQHQMYSSPDRLTHPLKRVGDTWQRVSWKQALQEIGSKVSRLRGVHPDSIAMYVGTAAGFGVLHPIFASGFMQGVGSHSLYSSATQDCANKFAASTEMYGFPFTQTFPDLERIECLILVGTNPAVSKWTFLQVPNPGKHLKAITERGGTVLVVDPRRTESAKMAGEHVFIRPNTDVYFYLSFLHELIESGGVDESRTRQFMTGYDEVRELVKPWTPERTAAVTHIAADELRTMVRAYREANGAALVSGTGVGQGSHGTLSMWLQETINAVSGNLDRPGGTLVGHGIFDFPKFGVKNNLFVNKTRSRIGNFEAVNDTFPGGILADEILTPGERQVRALFVTGGNPLLTMPNAGRLREALDNLELLVVTDIYLTETASHAHYVLPATSPVQRPDLPFLFPLALGLQITPYLAATEAIVPPDGEQRDEATIYLDLAQASGVNIFDSAVAQKLFQFGKWIRSAVYRKEQPSLPQRLLLSLILRSTKNGSFAKLLREPDGRLRRPHHGNDFLGSRVVTPDGKVHLAPQKLVSEVRGLDGEFEREHASSNGFKLISKRDHKTHNSWTHNIEKIVSSGFDTNHLYMHPQDAEQVGLAEGDIADVSTDIATVRLPVRLREELMLGTVAMPHGWGHQHADGLSVASKTSGVNVNLLAADGPATLEAVSGMAHLTGFDVQIAPASGPRDTTSWSGVASA